MLTLLVTVGMSVQAQTESVSESKSVSISTDEDGKITLKVTTKIGDDTKTFEKTYDSEEEMYDDPELEEYGITSDDLGFGSNKFSFKFASPRSNGSFHRMPNFSMFFDDDDNSFSNSFSFGLDIDSMMNQFHSNGPFRFHFGPGKMMDLDSLMSGFGPKGRMFYFGDDEFMDMDSLREKLMDRFKDMDFDFDFDDDEGSNKWVRSFSFGNDDEDDTRIISRVKVFIRSAREADKEKVGADEMEDLQIQDISFYPNPSDGRFALELTTGNENPVHIKIVGPDGSVVYERTGQASDGFYDYDIDISDQREGVYIMQVIQNNRALTKRIIIE